MTANKCLFDELTLPYSPLTLKQYRQLVQGAVVTQVILKASRTVPLGGVRLHERLFGFVVVAVGLVMAMDVMMVVLVTPNVVG